MDTQLFMSGTGVPPAPPTAARALPFHSLPWALQLMMLFTWLDRSGGTAPEQLPSLCATLLALPQLKILVVSPLALLAMGVATGSVS
jgi:hypothetical protein